VSVFAIFTVTFILLRSFISEYHSSAEGTFDLVDTPHLPEEPTALIIADARGRKKWSIWIPPKSEFPLPPYEYAELCSQAEELQKEFSKSSIFGSRKKNYYSVDPSFVDVDVALNQKLLHGDDFAVDDIPVDDNPLDGRPICEKSLTFVMETENAGMGPSLLALWLSFGMASEEGRAFFIDDTRW
jgi:hypothetical protein